MKFPYGTFDDEQINILRQAFEEVCAESGVREPDTACRNRIAGALMALAKTASLTLNK